MMSQSLLKGVTSIFFWLLWCIETLHWMVTNILIKWLLWCIETTALNGLKHLDKMATLMYWNCTVSGITEFTKRVTSNYIYNYSWTLCCKLLCSSTIYAALKFIVLVDWLNLWTHINITWYCKPEKPSADSAFYLAIIIGWSSLLRITRGMAAHLHTCILLDFLSLKALEGLSI